MTTQELKRDIIRLKKSYLESVKSNTGREAVEKELKRLYWASSDFSGLSAKHILILLRINLSVRVISLYNFGIHVNLEKL